VGSSRLAWLGLVAAAGHIVDNPRVRAIAAAQGVPARLEFLESGLPWGGGFRSDMVLKFARGNG
jgi:hypothetical protein